jgi:hypothetical protein
MPQAKAMGAADLPQVRRAAKERQTVAQGNRVKEFVTNCCSSESS